MADATADVVYADQVLEHMSGIDDARQFTAEALRVAAARRHLLRRRARLPEGARRSSGTSTTRTTSSPPSGACSSCSTTAASRSCTSSAASASPPASRATRWRPRRCFVNIPGVDALSRYTGTEELLFKIRKNLFETLTFVARKPSEAAQPVHDALAGSMLVRLAITAAILAYLATRSTWPRRRARSRRSTCRTCCSCWCWWPSIAR